MQIKSGATIINLNPSMRPALIGCQKVFDKHNTNFVITCGLDSTHSAGSLHYYGFAIDVRTRDLGDKLQDCYQDLLNELTGFDVVLESNHIHIENEIAFKEQWCK
jgi:hypothetical protein